MLPAARLDRPGAAEHPTKEVHLRGDVIHDDPRGD
jgi:hypothetical protein